LKGKNGAFTLSTIGKRMEKLGVGISFQHPLLPTSLVPVFFLNTEDFHHLPFKVVSKGPALLVQT
jgi:hypothetical protein